MGLDQYMHRTINPDMPVPTSEELYGGDDGIHVTASKEFGDIDHSQPDEHPRSYAGFKRFLATKTNNEEIRYWRKFNALHLWMERALDREGSNGDMGPLNLEQLAGLKVTLERVINDPSCASEQFPTGARFLFGSTEYDEWYMQDVKQTYCDVSDWLDEEEGRMKAGLKVRTYSYSSSW